MSSDLAFFYIFILLRISAYSFVYGENWPYGYQQGRRCIVQPRSLYEKGQGDSSLGCDRNWWWSHRSGGCSGGRGPRIFDPAHGKGRFRQGHLQQEHKNSTRRRALFIWEESRVGEECVRKGR